VHHQITQRKITNDRKPLLWNPPGRCAAPRRVFAPGCGMKSRCAPRHQQKMKPREQDHKPEKKTLERSRGTSTNGGLDVETKIFSASGRGRDFLPDTLFVEPANILNHTRR
jgi:hypothetical protein